MLELQQVSSLYENTVDQIFGREKNLPRNAGEQCNKHSLQYTAEFLRKKRQTSLKMKRELKTKTVKPLAVTETVLYICWSH